jgi:lipopolysaccharide export system permease protein
VGVFLSVFSVAVFGYMQPYSRYAYRAVMHAAVNAGWNGRLAGGAFIDDKGSLMTADNADIGRPAPDPGLHPPNGRARAAGRDHHRRHGRPEDGPPGGKTITMNLRDGRRIAPTRPAPIATWPSTSLTTETPLSGAATLLRARGGDERELTLGELPGRPSRPIRWSPRER